MIVQTLMGSSTEPAQIGPVEVVARGLIVFGFAILMVRLVTRRFLSNAAPFDVVLGVILGAALSRTINGPLPVILAMAGAILLALVYRLVGPPSSRDRWRPGAAREHGQGETKPQIRKSTSGSDPAPSRLQTGLADLKGARLLTLMRSAHISVLRRP